MTISLTPELLQAVAKRLRSGRHGNARGVLRAGLRALLSEEMGEECREWQRIKARLPKDDSTPEIEHEIVEEVRKVRRAEKRKTAKRRWLLRPQRSQLDRWLGRVAPRLP